MLTVTGIAFELDFIYRLFNDTARRVYSLDKLDDSRMMNWKGCGTKHSWYYLRVEFSKASL